MEHNREGEKFYGREGGGKEGKGGKGGKGGKEGWRELERVWEGC